MIVHECHQGTPEWFKLKAGVPSSSSFSKLVTGTGKSSTQLGDYAMQLALEKGFKGPIDDGFSGNKYTERGQELEESARLDYAMTRQAKIREVGFITDDLMKYGASTDGLVNEDGALEIKCLISKTFGELILTLNKNGGQTPPGYVPQIQGELLVTERDWVDLVFWHPRFEPIIHRHYPIPDFQKLLKSQIKKVITERNRIQKILKPYHI